MSCPACAAQALPGVLVELERDEGDGLWPDDLRFILACGLCRRYPDDEAAAAALTATMSGDYVWRRAWSSPTESRPFLAERGTLQDADVALMPVTLDPATGSPLPVPSNEGPPTMTCTCGGKAEPLGKKEVAELAEVEGRTVHTWRQRRVLPEADYDSVNGSEAWERSTIVLWLAATRRLPNRLRRDADAYTRALLGQDLDTWLAQHEQPRRRS